MQLNSNVLQVIDADNTVQVNNIGSYESTTGNVTITGFAPVSITGGQDLYSFICSSMQMKVQLFHLRNYMS
jgi:hypothetical protein